MENTKIKLFEDKQVRTLWDAEKEVWYFSVVDVCNVLSESSGKDPGAYWRKLKQRLKNEGSELVTKCHGLKLPAADGKFYKTDCLDTEGIFRLIQSIPSPKAEPFKLWMAQVAKERLDEMQDPEQGIQRALLEYRALGYSENWINQRLKSIEIRKDLTDEWKKHGLKEGVQFATLTDIIYKTWAGKTAKEYKEFKGLKKENIRDNFTDKESVLIFLMIQNLLFWKEEKKENNMGMRRLFIIRKDLHLSAGKLGAMVAHCAEGYWIRLIEQNVTVTDGVPHASFNVDKEIWDDYLNGYITKTICETRNLNKLMQARDMALEMGLVEDKDFGMINDACLTELTPEWVDENGEGRCTVGIWFKPLKDEVAHSISKKYKLYRD